MLKFFILAAVAITVLIQALPAYCSGVSKAMTFQMSVIVPEHVLTTSAFETLAVPDNPFKFQMVQTQIVTRNHQQVRLTSIVVP